MFTRTVLGCSPTLLSNSILEIFVILEEPLAKKPKTEEAPTANITVSSAEVQWEYKWENSDNAEILGPFTSSDMQQWVDEDKFPQGVFVRKVGSDQDFYTSRRIDFELYT